MYAPAAATLPGGGTVDIDTTYPFGDTATVTVSSPAATPVYLRVPGWATGATINGEAVQNGTAAGCRGRLPCWRTPPLPPASWLQGLRPLLRTPAPPQQLESLPWPQ